MNRTSMSIGIPYNITSMTDERALLVDPNISSTANFEESHEFYGAVLTNPATSTANHYIILVLIGMTSCLLSIVGSSLVIWISYRRTKFSKLYNRLVSLLSVCDIMLSVSLLLQPFMIKYQEDNMSAIGMKQLKDVFGIDTNTSKLVGGTTQTCTVVGFFGIHTDMAVSFANCFLSWYFVLRVCYGWQDRQIVAKNLELPVVLITLLGPLIIGIPGLATTSYNYNQLSKICWLDAYPTGCLEQSGGHNTCTRGGWYAITLALASILLVFIASVAGFYGTYKVYKFVKTRIEASTRRSFQGVSHNSMNKRLRDVSYQAMCYSFVYLNKCIWPFLLLLVYGLFLNEHLDSNDDNGGNNVNYGGVLWIEYLQTFFYPLQGFFNFLVFTRPNIQQWKDLYPDKSIWWAFRMELTSSDPPPSVSTRGGAFRNHNNTSSALNILSSRNMTGRNSGNNNSNGSNNAINVSEEAGSDNASSGESTMMKISKIFTTKKKHNPASIDEGSDSKSVTIEQTFHGCSVSMYDDAASSPSCSSNKTPV